VVLLSLGPKIPDHVAAVEETAAGTRYHCFLQISQRDEWIAADKEHRLTISRHHPRVLNAWDAFAVVLHAEPRAQRRLWNS
jgi:hypothetical protein